MRPAKGFRVTPRSALLKSCPIILKPVPIELMLERKTKSSARRNRALSHAGVSLFPDVIGLP